MSMRKCPKCGLPVAGMEICPVCGERIKESEGTGADLFASGKGEGKLKMGKISLTGWDVAFILLCNISFAAILINLIIDGSCWCHYPVFGLFTVYFLSFACASRSLKKFVTRFRNAVLILNTVAGAFNLIYNAVGQVNLNWAFSYFIPCNLLVACVLLACMLFFKSVPMRNVLFSLIILLFQSTLQFVLMLAGVTAVEKLPRALSVAAFGINLITAINLFFLYFVKYRNAIVEKFRFWE